jgi:hypothetical protein
MRNNLLIPATLAAAWLGAAYAVRFGLMENAHWVNVCDASATLTACELRRLMGLAIHFRVLSWPAVACAIGAWLLRDKAGIWLAWAGIFFGLPALVLYTATPASFALLIAALRLTRPDNPLSASPAAAQPAGDARDA